MKDISRKNHFNKCLNIYSDYGTCDHEEWVDYFNVMSHNGSGIMNHINIMMQCKHECLVHNWKKVDGYIYQMVQLATNVQNSKILCKDFKI